MTTSLETATGGFRAAAAAAHLNVDAQHPWPGPEAYDEASSDYFYGRKLESAEILRLIRLAPLTVVYGKSGLGKTSLLQAGLIPLLRPSHFIPVLKRLDFEEGLKEPPLEQMKQELRNALDHVRAEYPAMEKGESLWEYLHRKDIEFWSDDNFPMTPVLVFDQFEELFSRTGGNAELIRQVFNDLADLIENRIPAELASEAARPKRARLDLLSQHYRIVLSFREDFLPEIRTWEKQVPSLLRNYLRLEPMSRERAIEAVEQAGEKVLGPGVAPHIVDLVSKGDQQNLASDTSELVIEPVLLSLCCTQLNQRREPGTRIDKALVDAAGQDILESFYRSAMEDPSVRGEPDAARFIEDYLIQGDRYRGDFPKGEALDEGRLRTEQLAALTDKHRLLRIVHRGDTPRIELIHDRLVPVVRKARDHRRIQTQKEEQERKAQLAEAERDKERARSEELRAQATRLRSAFAIVAVLAIMALLAAGWAYFERSIAAKAADEANKQRAIAVKQTAIALEMTNAEKKETERADASEQMAKGEAKKAVEAKQIAQEKSAVAEGALLAERKSKESKEIAVETSRLAEGRQALRANSEPLEQTMYRALATYRLSTRNEEMEDARAPSLSAMELVLDTSGHLAKVVRLKGVMPTPALAYSPDGKTLAVGGEDGSIRLLDANDYHDTGHSLNCQQQSEPEAVWSLAFNSDGRRLVAGYSPNAGKNRGSGLICVFDLQQGSIKKWSSLDHGGEHADIYSVAYGGKPGKEFVVFGGSNKILRKWDLSTGQVVGVRGETEIVAVAVNDDESKVAAAGDDKIIRIWSLADLDNQGSPLMEIKGHQGTIQQMAFSPAVPKVLVSAGDDGRIIAWNLKGGCPTERSKQQNARIYGIAVNSNGIVASAGADGYVRLFRLSEKMAACPASKPAESSSTAPEPREFDVIPEGVLAGHGGLILAVAFDAEGDHLASAGQDGSIRVWVGNTGSFSVAQLKLGSGSGAGIVTTLAISPDGNLVAGGDNLGNISVWTGPNEKSIPKGHNAEPRIQNSTTNWKAHNGPIQSLIFVPVGDRLTLVSSGKEGVLKQWDVGSGKIIGKEMTGGATAIVSIALSPDGKTLAAGSYDGAVRLWDATTETFIAKVDPPDPANTPDYTLSAVGFTRDGKYLAIGSSWYPGLRIIDLKDRREVRWLAGHNLGISSISHGKSEWLLTSGLDGSVLEWQETALSEPPSQGLQKRDDFKFRTGFPELRVAQPLTAMATSADGKLVLTGGDKGQIQLWNGAEHVLISDHFTAYNKKIQAVAVARDGSFFVTADSSNILVWPGPDRWADILCSKMTQNMSDQHWREWISPSIPYTLQCPDLPKEQDARARR